MTLVCIIPGPSKELKREPAGDLWCCGCRKRLPHDWALLGDHEPSYYEPIWVKEVLAVQEGPLDVSRQGMVTMNQASLFASPNVRASDPHTSKLAARANPDYRVTLKARVLEAHRRFRTRGMTDAELAIFLGADRGSCAKRRGELEIEGLIEKSGLQRPNPTTGSPMLVYRARAVQSPSSNNDAEASESDGS